MDEAVKKTLEELLILALEDTISLEQIEQVNSLLKDHPERIRHTIRFLQIASHIKQSKKLAGMSKAWLSMDSQDSFSGFMRLMAEHEKKADAVEIEKEKEAVKQKPEKITPFSKSRPQVSKFSVYTLILSSAALIFLVAYAYFVSMNRGIEVATLIDSMGAQWAGTESIMSKGMRFTTGRKPVSLKEGLADLCFDNGAVLTLEGPAEFQILAEDHLKLNTGRLYATVPKKAIGFTIHTPNARIVDLGTEFGVEADLCGNTTLHVMEGKTMLLAGSESNKISMAVDRGSAKQVSGDSQTVIDIPYNDTHFVRTFDSQSEVIWRSQPSLDLADMVRNGNGLGTGNSNVRLDPVKGFTTDWHNGVTVAKGYLPISDHPFIDGIFVPDGELQQVVSSRGDVFDQCPDTSGLFDVDLFANPKPEILKTEFREGTIRFNGKEYTDESGTSCIVMHANRGLTFDLDSVRSSYHRSISRFTAQAGIADLHETVGCNADFWVLVDGQVRYSLRQYKQKGVLNDVSVEIKDTDRFLTLVTTDGGDPDDPEGGFYKRSISCDWCIFTEPIVELQ